MLVKHASVAQVRIVREHLPAWAPGLQFCTFQPGSFSSNGVSAYETDRLHGPVAPRLPCRQAGWLAPEQHLPDREINIEETPGAAEEVMQRTGKRGHSAVSFVIDGAWGAAVRFPEKG